MASKEHPFPSLLPVLGIADVLSSKLYHPFLE